MFLTYICSIGFYLNILIYHFSFLHNIAETKKTLRNECGNSSLKLMI